MREVKLSLKSINARLSVSGIVCLNYAGGGVRSKATFTCTSKGHKWKALISNTLYREKSYCPECKKLQKSTDTAKKVNPIPVLGGGLIALEKALKYGK